MRPRNVGLQMLADDGFLKPVERSQSVRKTACTMQFLAACQTCARPLRAATSLLCMWTTTALVFWIASENPLRSIDIATFWAVLHWPRRSP